MENKSEGRRLAQNDQDLKIEEEICTKVPRVDDGEEKAPEIKFSRKALQINLRDLKGKKSFR